MSRRRKKPSAPARPALELRFDELGAIVARAQGALSPEDHAKLKAALDTLAFLTAELERKQTSLARLRRLLFGASTEKTQTILRPRGAPGAPPGAGSPGAPTDRRGRAAGPPRPGHGRLGAAAYTGADTVTIAHPSLQRGDDCPGCLKGKIYPLAEPATLVRITGMAPLGATVYACERWRCNLCGEVVTAPAPEGIGTAKYDATATSMVGLLKYGCGLPFHRIEVLQRGLRIPLPAATQWELVRDARALLVPVWDELLWQAAQGEVLYNDDTTMKVLALTAEQRRAPPPTRRPTRGRACSPRGSWPPAAATASPCSSPAASTPARISPTSWPSAPPPSGHRSRWPTRSPPTPRAAFDTLLASCLAHARRRFVDVAEHFPADVQHVLEALRAVYHTDALARARALAPAERLQLHQTTSGPVLTALQTWLRHQLDAHLVEPNSGLGTAIAYMLKHWTPLTLFLRVPGAPLDNNICERALKKAILHRKNALFYRTLAGAHVGDVFMSLIHTAELNDIAPFDYLVALQRHHEAVALDPSEWLPWTYEATRAELQTPTDPVA